MPVFPPPPLPPKKKGSFMPKVELTKEECSLLVEAMKAGVEQAEAEIKSFDKDAKAEDVTTTLVARSLMMQIQNKMEKALAE
jgi:hypothetical protein